MQVSRDQMIIYKTCVDPKFNLTDEFCGHIEDYTNTSDYSAVEAEVADFNNVVAIVENVIPIVLAFYLGSWSDHWGRKPFLILCMFCKLLRQERASSILFLLLK